MASLLLARHGVTDWNCEERWQGLTDTSINEKGKAQARKIAEALSGVKIDSVYTSKLSRTKQTYEEIRRSLNLTCPVVNSSALDERDYGIYTGKNKREIEKELGHKEYVTLRRGWNRPIPEGETLRDVYNRVVPFYNEQIMKDLKEGKNVLVVSSGNTLRALVKYLENISDEDIVKLELNCGEIRQYEFDSEGNLVKNEKI